ncbi:myosin-IIIb-like isoform X2 [Labeo rohita]|uniref:Myosin-IIIb-like isoform X2 n=1 Tax=Labeo rohita TaxID=84645 RepID=A0A498LH10_LABRO|nr:myosin-IIIb-like isoform X2 [Labeo rohita]
MEQKEYKEEGITWDTITYKDNKPILDLFLTKPIGILSLLDEQSAFPQATDRDFVDKLNSKFKTAPNFEVVRNHTPLFTIVHYAGKHSLAVLMEKMFAAGPHFVRCIKPNRSKQPDQLDSKLVMDQLRYNGLMETIRIRRDGFSWRPTFREFAERYNILLLKPDLPMDKSSCMSILNSTELSGWKCG